MVTKHSTSPPVTIIENRSGWQFLDLQELWHYRDLFFFLVWRDVKVRYAQSILGIGWAVI
jgi:lipopolysaccharide transport system permease protein